MDQTPAAATLTAAEIVKEVKWNGYFDQFRKDCLADKSSQVRARVVRAQCCVARLYLSLCLCLIIWQPLFTNLEKLVQDLVQKYLGEQTWNSQLKRSDIRDKVIKRLNE